MVSAFYCKYGIKEFSEIVFNCLTNYRFLQLRIKSNKTGIYSLIVDVEFSIERLSSDATKKAVLRDISSALERDKVILVENHQPLHSCLCSSSSLVRNKVIPENMSGPGLRSNNKVPLAMEFLNHIGCGAFSHDKKLFAAGKERYLYLQYDGLSFETILGPVEVFCRNILHLEFSPDDRFVFFGRLDKWFSVREGCVVERSQFSENCVSYIWGSHICDGKYIAVYQPDSRPESCLSPDELIRWAKYELIRCPPKNTEVETSKIEIISDKTSVRDLVFRHYAEIFTNQIWNVQTGKPVLEETFLSQIPPFFFFWHMFPITRRFIYPGLLHCKCDRLACKTVSMWRLAGRSDDWEEECSISSGDERFDESLLDEMIDKFRRRRYWGIESIYTFRRRGVDFGCLNRGDERTEEFFRAVSFTRWTDIVNNLFPKRAPFHFQYSIAETSTECYSFINEDSKIFSKDKRWFLRRGEEIALFEREMKDKNALKDRSDLLLETQGVKEFTDEEFTDEEFTDEEFTDVNLPVFTDDNNALVYSTTSDNLYAISLVTGTKLRSISGLYPIYCSSGDRQDLGFVFSSTNESKVVLLRDLPVKFLVKSLPKIMAIKAVGVAFTSCSLFSVLFSNGSVGSWKIVDSSLVLEDFQQMKFFAHEFPAKKCFFSHSGELIVVDQGCRIVLFEGEKSTPIKEAIEGSIACLAFSADDSLILFCIQRTDDDQYFYMWDVNTSTLTDPLCLDRSVRFDMHVDCCCFSSDNSKLFFCNAFSVLVLKHEAKNAAVKTLQKRSINSHPSDICSHCTVSFDDKLLACCIANEIAIYSVHDLDKFYKVPHNHQGKIQYCKFLCGKRYLISYGMEGLMFLFDLVARQSIAYLRVSESCISIAISPNEDKIVCLESSDKMSLITLRGLELDLISNLEFLPSMASQAPEGAHILVAPVHRIEYEDEPYLIPADYLESSGSSDEYVPEDEMDNTSEEIIC